eukprot:TRINITY_DN6690_c1_g2_i1.p4 TRINITY_DN6690_c1_g2~~TRINITY_DN6690_c1_g2_i1.p4  ORF type:complete len:112 (+),score=2.37 TRINITY_DN6690_c1_g2_i1:860-1195(+)
MFKSATQRGKSFKIDSKELFLLCQTESPDPFTAAANTCYNLSSPPTSLQIFAIGGEPDDGGIGNVGVLILYVIINPHISPQLPHNPGDAGADKPPAAQLPNTSWIFFNTSG